MSTAQERAAGGLAPVSGYVKKSDLEELKQIVGGRGWQEKLLNRAMVLTIAYLKSASREDFRAYLFDGDNGEFEIVRRKP